jgi:predicted AlkP superfamily phosphohydrolase/phosphomutase
MTEPEIDWKRLQAEMHTLVYSYLLGNTTINEPQARLAAKEMSRQIIHTTRYEIRHLPGPAGDQS